jgi:hypothetical protein
MNTQMMRIAFVGYGFLLYGCGGGSPSVATQVSTPDAAIQDQLRKVFQGNATVSFSGGNMIVESNGLPNHPTATYPNADNPNSILPQRLRFTVPLKPQKADRTTPTPFGPIGVAINGIPLFNQYNREGGDAVRLEVFDSCCGHPNDRGMYHYHKYPSCIKSPFEDAEGKHSPVIGYMFDGFAIYGPNGEDGAPPKDLDDCNGHTDAKRGYHYHATATYPYLIGAYRGTPAAANFVR